MGVWGHDLGTSAADLLAPKPETFQQLVANMFPSGSGQLAKAVAEPYLVVGPPPVAGSVEFRDLATATSRQRV